MITFTSIQINNLASYELLLKYVPYFLIDEDVIKKLKEHLGTKCDEILIEYPYYDDDYLSTYYIHYAQKLRHYEKKCCRLHILKQSIYYGYIVLRPTVFGRKLGRTLIDPSLLIEEECYIALNDFKAHVKGNEIVINSFPWKSQERDIAVCAHTATWAILRYFGNKYKNYADTTIGEIVTTTSNDWGRKTPSIGLNPVQVSDVLKEFGFSPLILQNNKDSENEYYAEVMAYIESGVPMVGFLHPIRHAIAIIGHGTINMDILDDEIAVQGLINPETQVLPHSKLINNLLIADDNYFPYKRMNVGFGSSNSEIPYGFAELKYCVVPLYRRMQLVYNEVSARFETWMKEKVMDWETPCVSRIYLTSANSLKKEALELSEMNDILAELVLGLSMPRFVWCIDLASFDEYKAGLTSGRILIDSTASTVDEEPWILMHDKKKIRFREIDENSIPADFYKEINVPISPYKLYDHNLKHVFEEKAGESNE